MVTIEFQVFINFLIAVALGALVGMQREYEIQTNQRKDFAGLRTFSLISLFGATASFISMNVLNSSIFLYVTFGSVMLLIVAAYIAMVFHFKENEIGITTEISAILLF
ncbi:MgtC/SapB family protein [Candidatus Woesearchaeota archaeon]|nr:MgtC/SapB family protein [Candidatus Woesearchaeota archaeon]